MTHEDARTVSGGPQVDLDPLLAALAEQASRRSRTQDRLRDLIEANQSVFEPLDLPVILHRIAEATLDLLGAQYAAIGVVSPRGGLEQFVHAGMPPHQVDAIGHLPEGHGLLGALIEEPRPIRLDDLGADDRSVGFPPGHPPMGSFLGVPLRVRDEVYGNLYATNKISGSFTEEDEQLALALAAAAGVAIDNVRLFSETMHRKAWSEAASEVTAAALAEEGANSVEILVARVQQLAEADFVCVIAPEDTGQSLRVVAARGDLDQDLVGRSFPADDTVAAAAAAAEYPSVSFHDDEPLGLAEGLTLGAMMTVPLAGKTVGSMIIGRRPGGPIFTSTDLEMAATFAGQAAMVMELAHSRAQREQMALLEDRGRIARDLHDNVIQQLFASGLELQSALTLLENEAAADRVARAIGGIDDAILQIRAAIFAASPAPGDHTPGLRHRLIDVVTEQSGSLERTAGLTFTGALDLAVTGELADDVIAVTREGLANVTKHARAARASVAVTLSDDMLTVEVSDDGVGMGPLGDDVTRNGLRNLLSRARRWGGTMAVHSPDNTGTSLRWTVPLPQEGAADVPPSIHP